jgi:hypothetical protein
MHEIGLCLSDAEALRTQWLKGVAITNTHIKRFERASDQAEMNRLIEDGKI